MRFGILGPTQALPDGDRPVAVGGPGVRALLGLLALDAGRIVTIERLIDGLYGAEPPAGATNALQAQVSRLRQHLGDLVVRVPAGYRLDVAPDDVDALRFERLAAEGRRALGSGDHATAAARLREALGLWRGPALADVAEAPFAPPQAARLEELRLAAAEDLAEAGLALGLHQDLLAELRDRVTAHPLRERSRGQLIRALYGAGRQADALAEFDDARRRLADELGADPSAELAGIHLAVLRSDPSLSPPSPSRHSLPTQLTPLVGRVAELERIGALLAEARLVTLTGPGGTGKTRLALEAASRRPGEVCLVELASLEQGADVARAVLGAFGLRESGLPVTSPGARHSAAPDPLARLVAALSGRAALLVLDNCEHVIDDAAGLADRLLRACPALRILATSREALGITGERLYPVPPLEVPPPGTPPAEALGYPAVRLFAERAGAVRPGFRLDAETTPDVLAVCRALDGLPLAIELAAARLRALPAAEIAARLGDTGTDRFSLLSRGSRTAQPRHRTLRAVVEWSWDLLDDAERALARRLTVFAGGATLEAAERVCGLPDTDGVLASLVDKSLVELVDDRYRMLETIRAFCAGKLAEAGEEERFREAHGAYFLDLALTADPHLRAAGQIEWLNRLDAEHDNLHTAVRRATEAGDVERGLRLLSAAVGYWLLRGLRGEVGELARPLLDEAGPHPVEGLEEEHALCVCLTAWGAGDAPGLRPLVDEAIRAIDAGESVPRQPFLLVLRAIVGGPPDRADQVALADRYEILTMDPWTLALAEFSVGYLKLFDGRVAEAEKAITTGLARARTLGDLWTRVLMLAALADVAVSRGDHPRVEALANEALELAERLGATIDVAETLCRRARARARTGAEPGARADYERAAELSRRVGAPEILAEAYLGLGELARLGGRPGDARRLYEAALAECEGEWFTAQDIRARIYVALGRAAETAGDAAEALAWHRRALSTRYSDRSFGTTAEVADGLAGVALLEGDPERAARLLGVGSALRGSPLPGDPDNDRVSARCRAALGDAPYAQVYAQAAAATRAKMDGLDETSPPALTVLEGHLSAFGG
ncbi:BTAD domain-containing putative transcriptional regulator [Microbispora sp. NPDC049125]|uniref:BTAD domain-containing putative transcriptional regulator n=1 Tax=Microbispora sp. NPDC049125 TaxID=3154929 RepID=UPI00346554E9